ncbi:MAG: NAD-dependent epimerase/dehydratase family protein [Verrucomicrobiota bacterium]
MAKVLITGGAGFIGSHLAEFFLSRGDSVRVLDDLRSGNRTNLENLPIDLRVGSVVDREVVSRAVDGIDYICHLAAMVSVPESMDDPIGCVEVNVTGLLNMLEAAAGAGVKKLCHSSSAAIYGDNPTVPKVESMTPEPKSPYAITKLDGEYFCRLFREEKKLETVCLRYFNVFGERQDPGSAYAAAVPIFMRQACEGKPLRIFGDGGQTRDFVYVKDVVAANVHALENESMSAVYNVGYGRKTTILELAERIKELAGSDSEIEFREERSGDVRHSSAATDKLRASGFQPAFDLEEGLARTLASFREG